jgi:hypothetical protein
MKAKAKSSKSVRKKPAAKKKSVSTARKKKTSPKSVKPKSVKKTTAAKKTRKAVPGKKAKKPAVKKKSASTAVKKKTSFPISESIALKARKPVKKPPAAGPIVSIVRETFVSMTTTEERIPPAPPPGLLVGKVTHYYNHSNVAIIELEAGNLHIGDTVQIKGHTTDFEQVIRSMEIEHQGIETAEAGETIGVKVRDVVREHDKVYKK